MTGHDHHFLSRLDRVSDEHVELALMLYRDPFLVGVVLNACRFEGNYERVAFALGPRDVGPLCGRCCRRWFRNLSWGRDVTRTLADRFSRQAGCRGEKLPAASPEAGVCETKGRLQEGTWLGVARQADEVRPRLLSRGLPSGACRAAGALDPLLPLDAQRGRSAQLSAGKAARCTQVHSLARRASPSIFSSSRTR